MHRFQILALNCGFHDWKACTKLGIVQQKLDVGLPEMIQLVTTNLHIEPYSRAEIEYLLQLPAGSTEFSTPNTQHSMFQIYRL